MPEVIGKDQSVYKQLTCKHCGSINRYLPNEVRTLWSGKTTLEVLMVLRGLTAQDVVNK
jgi:hypothetical protein